MKLAADYLVGLGIDTIGHTGDTFLSHVLGVYHLLLECGRDEEVCLAGLFHSIYGTETTRGFALPLARREEIRSLVGERAERLAYLNCALDRATLDRAVESDREPFLVTDRLEGREVELSPGQFDDLCSVHLCDWLEQVARSWRGFGYRRAAYRRMAERLGQVALYSRVFDADGRPGSGAASAAPLPGDEAS